ncbi:MAG: hypothetical protein PHG71_06865 [Kiritimatiellae bacterium]|nr:hypothetical protein [Kiritimatiellia bacterium]MDD4622941.1 hypothetical protein [Kiritimatiellia bacterium]
MSDNNEDNRQWFLRINGETVFGPVSTQGLVLWAEQGRILPGHEVSADRKKWEPATGVDFLGMRWFVDDTQGDLRGPLNRLAAEALIKSGKVPEGSRLVENDDAQMPDGQSAANDEEIHHQREAAMPEDILRRRIRELESMVSEQRARLTKLSDADAIEAIQQERDVLSALVKEAEEQRDSIKRSAEKEARANERKQESLRQQIKKLEQECEEANNRLILLDEAAERRDKETIEEAAKMAVMVRQEAVDEAQREKEMREEALRKETQALRAKLAESEKSLASAFNAFELRLESMTDEADALRKKTAELERELHDCKQALAGKTDETQRLAEELESERARSKQLAEDSNAAKQNLRATEERLASSEAAFAELLNDANARDTEYREKIEMLEKDSAQSPEERARFHADQAAVYDLVKAEVSELSEIIEAERSYIEGLKKLCLQRQQKLLDRRQKLLKHVGGGPNEMARRSGREQPSDAQLARLRADLENMRVTYQRELKFAETKERDYKEKIELLEKDANRLKTQMSECERNDEALKETLETLKRCEADLSEERRAREAEREQFRSNQQALLKRIDTLEKQYRVSSPEEIQSTEARSVKLASWMRLKR